MAYPLRISRSGLKLFLECPRCFWLDVHHKVKRPPGYPYTLSAAVDFLVKKEFDGYRVNGQLPPVLKEFGIDAALYAGPELAVWRNNFKGIAYTDESLNATLYGAVDDILEFSDGSLAVVDYKSTGAREVTIYDDYRKQMDTYTYILQQMGYRTQPEAYFVFFQVQKDRDDFGGALHFASSIKPLPVDPTWVGGVFEHAVRTARQDTPPEASPECQHCTYVHGVCKHAEPFLHATTMDKDYVITEGE